jgi:hypothetical protein
MTTILVGSLRRMRQPGNPHLQRRFGEDSTARESVAVESQLPGKVIVIEHVDSTH